VELPAGRAYSARAVRRQLTWGSAVDSGAGLERSWCASLGHNSTRCPIKQGLVAEGPLDVSLTDAIAGQRREAQGSRLRRQGSRRLAAPEDAGQLRRREQLEEYVHSCTPHQRVRKGEPLTTGDGCQN